MASTVHDGQDSDVQLNDQYLTLQKEVRFRGRTEIVAYNHSMTTGLEKCESW